MNNHMLSWRAQILETKLHRNAKYLAMILSTYMNEWGDSAFPTRKTLAGRSGMSPRTIDAAVAVLVEAGWLLRQERFREDGGQTSNNYIATHPEYPSQGLRGVLATSAKGVREVCDHNSSSNSFSKKKEAAKPLPRTNKFVPPTLEEIQAYVQEKKYIFLPEDFFDHYETNGWMVGLVKMKNWKSAASRWHRTEVVKRQGTQNQPTQARRNSL